MQKNIRESGCEHVLNVMSEMEDLAEKKAKIYSRLLTDAELAQEMEALSNRHKQRKQTLYQSFTSIKTKNTLRFDQMISAECVFSLFLTFCYEIVCNDYIITDFS